MSFDRKLVELKVRGAEPTLNEHLAKLLAFDVDERRANRGSGKCSASTWATSRVLRVKPDKRLVPRRDWWAWLYDDPFEGNEEGYADHLIAQHEDEYPRNRPSTVEVAARIRDLHAALADRLARGDPGADLIEAL